MGVEISNLSVEHIVPWLEHCVPFVELWLLHIDSQRRLCRWVLKSVCRTYCSMAGTQCSNCRALVASHSFSEEALQVGVEIILLYSICRTYCSVA